MSSGKLVLGVLAGIAAGALIGVLFAPEKGSRTRKNIVRKGEDCIDDIQEKFNELFQTVTNKIECASQCADEIVSSGKKKYEEAKSEIKNDIN
jgi:gas vesicle protein